jgi:hypothetical protein
MLEFLVDDNGLDISQEDIRFVNSLVSGCFPAHFEKKFL